MAECDCLPMKMKRKEIDRVNDEFSDFSLSFPATKIRRLDLEEETQSVPLVNEDRAIVLYKPPQHYQSSSGNLFVDRNLISGLKNKVVQNVGIANDAFHVEEDDKNQAVVPWDPCRLQCFEEPSKPEIFELDGEDAMMEEAAMDVVEEEVNKSNIISLPQQQLFMGGLQQQWPQKQLHCMIPQLPQTNSTPISWFQ